MQVLLGPVEEKMNALYDALAKGSISQEEFEAGSAAFMEEAKQIHTQYTNELNDMFQQINRQQSLSQIRRSLIILLRKSLKRNP